MLEHFFPFFSPSSQNTKLFCEVSSAFDMLVRLTVVVTEIGEGAETSPCCEVFLTQLIHTTRKRYVFRICHAWQVDCAYYSDYSTKDYSTKAGMCACFRDLAITQ